MSVDYAKRAQENAEDQIDSYLKKEKDLEFVREFIQSMIGKNLGNLNLDYKNITGRWIKVKDQLELAVNLEKSLNKWLPYEFNHLNLTDLVNEHLNHKD
jgi:hypothetical protein